MTAASLSGFDRGKLLAHLERDEFDVLIVGGGITGAGVALDAQARGMRTALIEMQDFAAGTSSRSTKLVHGGLRYLKQLEVKLVAEVGRERAIVYENAPHVTMPERMLLPIYRGGTLGLRSASAGLRLYDYLARVRKPERRTMLGAAEALEREPLLKRDGLLGAGCYVEYRTDDARLTIEALKEAAARGCCAVNYVKAERFEYAEDGRISGVQATDERSGRTCRIRAKLVVNAAGPWVDELRDRDGSKTGKTLQHTKGVHLVFDGSAFPLRQAVYFDAPDGRMIFAIPRDGKTYVGTTDTWYEGDLANPQATAGDRDYLLAAVRAAFPPLRLGPNDVEASWAGIRPLIREAGKKPSDVSRKDEIWQSGSGLISVAGGKLTGYRTMAEAVTDRAAAQLQARYGLRFPPCATRTIKLSGGDVGGSEQLADYVRRKAEEGVASGFSYGQAERVARRYGSNVDRVFELYRDAAAAGELPPMPADLAASLLYAMHEEMAVTPVDFLLRRIGALLFDRQTALLWKEHTLAYMAERYRWSEAETETRAAELERAVAQSGNAPGE